MVWMVQARLTSHQNFIYQEKKKNNKNFIKKNKTAESNNINEFTEKKQNKTKT